MPHVLRHAAVACGDGPTLASPWAPNGLQRGRTSLEGRRVSVSDGVTRAIGNPGVTRVARLITGLAGGRLPVLAYHGVPDRAAFALQMRYIAAHFRTLSAQEVEWALEAGEVPRDGVWLTFDDGDPSVFTTARDVIDGLGLTATAYVCPGVVGTREPFWWDVARAAAERGDAIEIDGRQVPAHAIEPTLKRCSDAVRRETVARLRSAVEQRLRGELVRAQATVEQLRSWQDAGHGIGNHTWDHPCLDRCPPAEQVRQVELAHEWLLTTLGGPVTSFAYPNGNWAAETERTLQRLGYRTALGFDHRIARPAGHPLRLSRLRLDADAEPVRLRAVVSGGHSALMAARNLARPATRSDPRRLP
jgi:peptidoglycan/xylan/chitin deacetylase (PgdA/CDA1 family)